ncbi:hypothetical protein [Anaerobutyricum hallii]
MCGKFRLNEGGVARATATE